MSIKKMHPKTGKKIKLWRLILGAILILIGIFALVTPLTPGSWLAVIGLELIGIRFLFFDRVRDKIRNHNHIPGFIKNILDKIKND